MSKALYKDLDTAFVNLPSLIRHLCRKGFEGRIHVGMDTYEADILLSGCNEIEVQETDLLTGRSSEGEEAMQRLLIRAKEAGGTVSVYGKSAGSDASPELPALRPQPQIPVVQARASASVENLPIRPEVSIPVREFTAFPDAEPLEEPRRPVFTELVGQLNQNVLKSEPDPMDDVQWRDVLTLTSEILATIDRSLAACRLDFSAAFAKASSELTNDYLFLRSVSYSNGILKCGERPAAGHFVSGIMDVLKRVMHRLGAEPRFSQLHRNTIERVVDMVHRNKDRYDVHHLTQPLYRVIGLHP